MLCPSLLLALAPVPAPSPQFPQIASSAFPNFADGDRYGTSVAVIDDMDGDGVADYAVGRPGYDVGFFGLIDVGDVFFRSGATGVEIERISTGTTGLELGGAGIAGGFDSDLDGVQEIAITSPATDSVWVFEVDPNGVNSLVATIFASSDPISAERQFGAALANVGDLDGDGRDDLAIGIPERVPTGSVLTVDTGRVRIVSGADFSTVLLTLTDGILGGRFGSSLAPIRDASGEVVELAVGAPGTGTQAGAVSVHSIGGWPAVGVIDSFLGAPGDRFGATLAELDDVDGGGRRDLAVGAPGFVSTVGTGNAGRIAAFGLETDAELWSLESGAGLDLPGTVLAAGDFDADGRFDLATIVQDVTPTGGRKGRQLALFEIPSGSELARFDAWPASDEAGTGNESISAAIAAIDAGAGRARVAVGYPEVEFGRGGEVAYGIDTAPSTAGLGPYVVEDLASADFTAVSYATLVVPTGSRVHVRAGDYDDIEINRSLAVFEPTGQTLGVSMGNVVIRDAGEVTLANIRSDRITVERVGRAILSPLNAESIRIVDCPDASVSNTQVFAVPQSNGTAFPGIEIDQSFVQLRSLSVIGASGAASASALRIKGGSQVWSAGCLFVAVDPEPAIAVESGSELDLRGGSSSNVQSGVGGVGLDLEVAPGASARLSPTLPPMQFGGGGSITLVPDGRPWIGFASITQTGLITPVTYFDELGTVAALFVGFQPIQLPVPTVVDIPVLIDLGSILPGFVVQPQGHDVGATTLLTIPPDPQLSGLALELQGFTLRPDGLFDGTNRGRLQIR